MPSGRDFIVERVYEGMRVPIFEHRTGSNFVVLEEDDHIHVLLGSDEELEPFMPKPAPKPAPKKTAAKKKAS